MAKRKNKKLTPQQIELIDDVTKTIRIGEKVLRIVPDQFNEKIISEIKSPDVKKFLSNKTNLSFLIGTFIQSFAGKDVKITVTKQEKK